VVISELRSFTIKAQDGSRVSGAEVIDPVWARMVEWHGLASRQAARDQSRESLERQILAAKGDAGRDLLARLDSLEHQGAAAP
jgi:hypothetical protein